MGDKQPTGPLNGLLGTDLIAWPPAGSDWPYDQDVEWSESPVKKSSSSSTSAVSTRPKQHTKAAVFTGSTEITKNQPLGLTMTVNVNFGVNHFFALLLAGAVFYILGTVFSKRSLAGMDNASLMNDDREVSLPSDESIALPPNNQEAHCTSVLPTPTESSCRSEFTEPGLNGRLDSDDRAQPCVTEVESGGMVNDPRSTCTCTSLAVVVSCPEMASLSGDHPYNVNVFEHCERLQAAKQIRVAFDRSRQPDIGLKDQHPHDKHIIWSMSDPRLKGKTLADRWSAVQDSVKTSVWFHGFRDRIKGAISMIAQDPSVSVSAEVQGSTRSNS